MVGTQVRGVIIINALNDFIEVKQIGCLEIKIYVTNYRN